MMNSQKKTNNHELCIGIDVGGTHVRVTVSDGITFSEVQIYKTPKSYDELIVLLLDLITKAGSVNPINKIGIGLPGRTDPEKPIWIPMLSFLNQSHLIEDLMDNLEANVTLINDAQAALVGEVNFGAAKGCRNVILVTLGTGIGGGVMIDGKIYVGHNGTAGSFGWLLAPVKVYPNPELGPWERWASGNSLQNTAENLGLSISQLLNDAPHPKDSPAESAVSDFALRVGKGLGSLASLFDPQVVIVSGGLVNSWNVLERSVNEGFHSTASPSVRKTPIKVAELGSNAGAIGASITARNYFNDLNNENNNH
jgi:hypothetical protein